MRDFALIADALADAVTRGERAVLATVVRTEGSTYRRTGARMVFMRDGRTTGAVSGGCLEADLAARVDDIIAAGRPQLATYDTRSADDLVWGLGLGCNGRVDVLLEPLAGDALAEARSLYAWCRDVTAPAVLTTVIAAAAGSAMRVGDRFIVGESGVPVPSALVADASEALQEGRSSVRTYGALGLEVLHELITPPISLLVCGAGVDALPLVHLATGLGWRVTVADHRPHYAQPERFPGARAIVPDDGMLANGHVYDAAVVMSHHYARDLAYIRDLLAARVPYIGVLGPRRRTERMVAELGASEADGARLFAPVGLDIGAETPDEIALSIVAEVQAVKAGRRGGPLRDRLGGIHDGIVTVASESAPVGAVVLAAGGSTRLGQPKQLVEYEGVPLVVRAVDAALRAGANPVVVVLGAAGDAVRAALADRPVVTVGNPAWEEGIGTSIGVGVRALVARAPAVRGVLISLADQPLVDAAALGRLLDAWKREDDAVAAAGYADTLGVPAVFGRPHFDALLALPPDKGAAMLLRAEHARVREVRMPEAELDVDTPRDLERLGSSASQRSREHQGQMA